MYGEYDDPEDYNRTRNQGRMLHELAEEIRHAYRMAKREQNKKRLRA